MMATLSIPPAIDELLVAASRHRGLSPSLTAGLASIVRSVMRAYAGTDVDLSQLVRALKKIGQCLTVDGSEAGADAAAREDLAALARLLARVVDRSIVPPRIEVAPAPAPVEVAEPPPREPVPIPTAWHFTRDVAVEHLDEAAFCRRRWDAALCAPDYTAAEVQHGPEERLRAHLDALVLGGRPVADELLLPGLTDADPAIAFAAAWCLLASEEGDFDDDVLGAFAAADDARRPELARALALAPSRAVGDRLSQALLALAPPARSEAARLLTRWFARPAEIRGWLAGDDVALAGGAVRGLGGDLSPWTDLLERHLRAADPAVRAAAIRPGLCAGLVAAWDACVGAATGPDPRVADLVALATLGGAAERSALERALQLPAARRAALFALGFSGRRRAAEVCLEFMDVPASDSSAEPALDLAVARVAGEAFSAITGLVIEGAFARREPDGEDLDEAEPGPGRATPAEARLPLPDGPLIRDWWSSAARRFEPDQRYLGGAPLSAAALVQAIAAGPMRRRPSHAFELAVRTRGAFFVDTADWVSRQRAALAATAVPLISDFTALFGAGD